MLKVRNVEHAGGYKLALSFSDGTSGEADISAEITRPAFAPLRDVQRFAEAFVDVGTVCWPGGLDLAPERLYALTHGLTPPETLEAAKANELEVSLRELRRIAGKRQTEVATSMGMDQGELSRFERRDDRMLSTLRRYVQALGGELEVAALIDGKRIAIRGV
jgi:hypothetical protein